MTARLHLDQPRDPETVALFSIASAAHGAAWRLMSLGVVGGCTIAWTVLLVRSLSAHEVGSAALALGVGTVAGGVASCGLSLALQRAVGMAPGDHLPLFRAAVKLAFRGIGFVGLVGCTAAVVDGQRRSLWLAATAVAVAFVIQDLTVGYWRGRLRPRQAESVLAVSWLLTMAATIPMIHFGSPSGEDLVMARAATMAALVIPVALAASRARPSSRDVQLGLWRGALPVLLSTTAWTTIQWGGVVALGVMTSRVADGTYQPVLQLLQIGAALSLVPAAYFVSVASEELSLRGGRDLLSTYVALSKWGYLAGAPVPLTLLIAPDRTLGLAFGHRFAADSLATRIAAVAYLVNMAFGMNGQALVASGAHKALIRWSAASVVSTLALNGVLVGKWGLTGAAIALLASVTLFNAGLSWSVYRVARLHQLDRRYGVSVVAVGLFASLALGTLQGQGTVLFVTACALTGVASVMAALIFATDHERRAYSMLGQAFRVNVRLRKAQAR